MLSSHVQTDMQPLSVGKLPRRFIVEYDHSNMTRHQLAVTHAETGCYHPPVPSSPYESADIKGGKSFANMQEVEQHYRRLGRCNIIWMDEDEPCYYTSLNMPS